MQPYVDIPDFKIPPGARSLWLEFTRLSMHDHGSESEDEAFEAFVDRSFQEVYS